MSNDVKEIENYILRIALMNAIKYNGKANMQAVLGKLFAKFPELRKDARDIAKMAKSIIDRVNRMSIDEQRKLLEELSPVELPTRPESEERKLPPLPNVDKWKNVVMRLAPFPSGPLHIGNARPYVLNDEYVKLYQGKLLLVIDDTIGSETKQIVPEAYELIPQGLKWLGIEWEEPII